MAPPSILLLAAHHALADRLTALLRDGGFDVVPGWFNDARHPIPGSAPVDLVLVDLRHHTARSPAFTRMAAQLGVALAYFDAEPAGEGSEASDAALLAEFGGADGSAPVLPLSGDGAAFLGALRPLLRRAAPSRSADR